MQQLEQMREVHEDAHVHMLLLIDRKFPGATIWHWHRAVAAIEGRGGRRNDDQTNDVALASDVEIRAAFDEYIRLLHIFYRARDGEHGVLGGQRTTTKAVA